MNEVQATGEACSPQKRTSSTSKHEISWLFSIFVGHFCPSDLIESGSNPDPKHWFSLRYLNLLSAVGSDPDPIWGKGSRKSGRLNHTWWMVLPSGPTIRTSMSRNPPSATSNMRPIFVPDFTCGKSNFSITFFSVADPKCLSRIRTKEFRYFNPKKWFLSSRKYDSDFSSRIRILTFYPSRIQGSKRHRIPDPQHWLLR